MGCQTLYSDIQWFLPPPSSTLKSSSSFIIWQVEFNPLTPNDLYISHTAPLTSKRCILYIYSTNVGISLQNAVCFIMLTSLVPVLFTFYKQDVLKLKKKKSGAKRLNNVTHVKCRSKVFPLCTIKTYERNKVIALSILSRSTSWRFFHRP